MLDSREETLNSFVQQSQVVPYPFIMMDTPLDKTMPDRGRGDG